tara:strand:- start:3021 stop:3434 length:414 start_codon:yes stop_codon:yes gene_type:complete
MTAIAGYSHSLLVATSKSGTYSELYVNSDSFDRAADILDVTDTGNVGYHSRIVGLKDSSFSAEGFWRTGDTGQDIVEAAYENNTELWIKVLPDNIAGNGKKAQVVVESFNMSLDVTSPATFSASLQGTGAVFADDAT